MFSRGHGSNFLIFAALDTALKIMDFLLIWIQHSGSGGPAAAGPMTAERQTASEIRSRRGAPQWGASR